MNKNNIFDKKTCKCNLCESEKCKYIFSKNKYDLFKCTECNFVFVYPIPEDQILENHYKESYESGGYNIYATSEDIRIKINEFRFENLKKYNIKGKILDVGCGVGYFLNIAFENNLETYGVEYSEEGVKKARVKNKNIFHGSLEDAKYQKSFFDNVSVFDVIEHVTDSNATINEISRIIKPGGFLILSTPDISSWHAKVFKKRWGLIIPPEHLTYFSSNTISYILKKNGFAVLEIKKNYKIFTFEYLLKLSKYFFPGIYPISKLLLKILPSPFLKKYRRFFIGEMFVVAKKQ